MQPSNPGYEFSAADLAQAAIPVGVLNQLIAPAANGAPVDMAGLLAALIKTQPKAASNFVTYPYSIASGNAQQVLPSNPLRTSLVIALNVVSSATVFVLLDQGPISQSALQTTDTPRCLQVDSANTPFIFFVAPTNAITLLAAVGDIQGVILEGTQK